MIRDAKPGDLSAIVDIYNASIPGRLATADLEPVTLESRRAWFDEHDASHYALWVDERGGDIVGWFSFGPFYQRAAWDATAEVSLYVTPASRRQGVAKGLLGEAIVRSPELGFHTLLGLIFGHNAPSLALFGGAGFEVWGNLPGVCDVDGVSRDMVIVGRHVGVGA